jgi:hypothetical protein
MQWITVAVQRLSNKENKCWLQFLRSLHPRLEAEVPTRWNYVLIGYKKFQSNVDYVLKL